MKDVMNQTSVGRSSAPNLEEEKKMTNAEYARRVFLTCFRHTAIGIDFTNTRSRFDAGDVAGIVTLYISYKKRRPKRLLNSSHAGSDGEIRL